MQQAPGTNCMSSSSSSVDLDTVHSVNVRIARAMRDYHASSAASWNPSLSTTVFGNADDNKRDLDRAVWHRDMSTSYARLARYIKRCQYYDNACQGAFDSLSRLFTCGQRVMQSGEFQLPQNKCHL